MRKLLMDRRGVSSIEYAVLAVGIIAMVVAAVAVLSPDLTTAFSNIGQSLVTATTPKTAG